MFSGERFKSLRHSILFNPGKGANHEIVIEVQGADTSEKPTNLRATVLDPKGQTHLTAVGAAIQLDRLLGLDGATSPAPSVVYPDTAPQTEHALRVLRNAGIEIKIEPSV